MTEYIYGDVLFVIDFSMDFIALFSVGKLLHRKMKTRRIITAAVLGGVYGVCSLLFDIGTVLNVLCDFAVAAVLCITAFGMHGFRRWAVSVALFYGISMLIGGTMTAIFLKIGAVYDASEMPSALDGVPLWYFAAAAVASVIICRVLSLIMKKKCEAPPCRVDITFRGKSATLSAMCDSGNTLREPISDTPVIFIGMKSAGFIPDEIRFYMGDCALLTGEAVSMGLRVVPCATVNGKSLIVACRPDSLTVDGVPRSALLAISDDGFDGYDALVPSEFTGG